MKKLYEIWYIGSREIPVKDMLSVFPFYRDEVISTNLEKIQITLDRLNLTCYEDDKYRYEIREIECPLD